MKKCQPRIVSLLGAVTFIALSVQSGLLWADKTLTCRMKLTFVESRDAADFEAKYVAKDGPDSFTAKVSSPNYTANVQGTASGGTWTIPIIYTDAKHKGMTRKLSGVGTKDQKNQLTIKGKYDTFLGSRDVKASGTFLLAGTCK
jgi:hypothetical protein